MATKRRRRQAPWNKGKIIGQKAPLKLREIWAIRVRLQFRSNLRDLALFNLAIDSKLRACDLLSLRVGDIAHENHVNSRAVVLQRETRRPVQFSETGVRVHFQKYAHETLYSRRNAKPKTLRGSVPGFERICLYKRSLLHYSPGLSRVRLKD
jgi:hypothetical protein